MVNGLWHTWVQSCVCTFLTGQLYIVPHFKCIFCSCNIIVEQWDKCELQGLQGFQTLFLTCLLLLYTARLNTCHVLLLLLPAPM